MTPATMSSRRRAGPSPGGGRAANVAAGTRYAGTTSQLCGLFPFAVASGADPDRGSVGAQPAHRRAGRARPRALAAHRADQQHRGVGAGPTRDREVLDHQTPRHRPGRVRDARPDPRRHQRRIHPAHHRAGWHGVAVGPRTRTPSTRSTPAWPPPPWPPPSAPQRQQIGENLRTRTLALLEALLAITSGRAAVGDGSAAARRRAGPDHRHPDRADHPRPAPRPHRRRRPAPADRRHRRRARLRPRGAGAGEHPRAVV